MIEAIFAAFGITALSLFLFVAPSRAVAIACFAGWLILPIGNFPPGSASAVFPYWITGVAVPSDMLFTKMWFAPVVALAGAVLTDRASLLRWRPSWLDAPIALWCLLPIGQWIFVSNPEPQPWIASLYLAGAWGAPWLLGRVYFCGPDGGRQLIAAIVAGLAVILPIALIEGAFGPVSYGEVYELHPFRLDGAERYVGFRPLAFFENGNQYGIWAAAIALAAIWLWQTAPNSRLRNYLAAAAGLGLTVALMSQSVGAIVLLCAALALCWIIGRPLKRWMIALGFLLIVVVGAIYFSGAVPLRALAEGTAIGHTVVDVFRSTGRGSFIWRMARDQRALSLISEHPIIGTARWDWWRPNGERPWGLFLMIVGQFGVVGVVLAFGSLMTPTIQALKRHWYPSAWHQPAVALAVIVLIAVADALLNSFFFYPAIVAAGALVEIPAKVRRSSANPVARAPIDPRRVATKLATPFRTDMEGSS